MWTPRAGQARAVSPLAGGVVVEMQRKNAQEVPVSVRQGPVPLAEAERIRRLSVRGFDVPYLFPLRTAVSFKDVPSHGSNLLEGLDHARQFAFDEREELVEEDGVVQ